MAKLAVCKKYFASEDVVSVQIRRISVIRGLCSDETDSTDLRGSIADFDRWMLAFAVPDAGAAMV